MVAGIRRVSQAVHARSCRGRFVHDRHDGRCDARPHRFRRLCHIAGRHHTAVGHKRNLADLLREDFPAWANEAALLMRLEMTIEGTGELLSSFAQVERGLVDLRQLGTWDAVQAEFYKVEKEQ